MKPIVLSTLSLVPVALGLNPAGRWGHQAVYVPSQAAMYVVGGQVSTTNFQITNDVLVYPLNTTTPTFSLGANDGLPPHAFASMAMTADENNLIVFGGMTSSCHNDGLLHTMDLDEGDWSSITPASVERRRGAGMAWVDTGSGQGGMMVVGGIADEYSCAASKSPYTAADILALPLRASSLLSSRNLPSALTGDQLAVADYAMISKNGSIYMIGGQSASGSLVDLTSIGVWDETNGWHSETTSGDVPSGRIGASLVAHPTLDLLILHGGSTSAPSGTDSPSELVAILDTTSMVWSQPADLQPASSAARSHHSSIVTPSGIMISAFGLSSSNTPRSDVSYLDARGSDPASWTWATTWSANFLQPSTSTIKKPETETAGKSNLSGGTIAGIVVPLLLLSIIGLPIIVYLIRRRLRLIKKRKMAEHFSFSSQVDDNDTGGFFGRRGASGRVTNAQYPFGRDANEKEGTFMTDLGNKARGLLKRYSTRSTISSVGNRSVDEDAHEVPMGGYSDKEMRPMTPLNPRSAKWEEIDFGLGRLDESRRASALDPYEPTAMINNDQPLINISSPDLEDESHQHRLPAYGSPVSGGPGPLIPFLVVQPPSNPSTPGSQHVSMHPSPLQSSDPFADPMPTVHEYAPPTASDDDWSMLQNQLASKPAFRSISPTSTLRSHQHPSQQQQSPRNISSSRPPVYAQNSVPTFSASPRSRASSTFPIPAPAPAAAAALPRSRSTTPPQLPPLDLGRTITLVNQKTGRRISETLPLAGRRGSMPMARSPSSSGSTTPTANYDNTLRRASNPMPIPVPSPVSSPVLDSATNGQRRVSAMSKLRVMNPSSDDESTESAGLAL